MDNIWQDPEILAVALLTIKVSGIATIISIILGIPLGLWLALNEFPGKKLLSAWSILAWGCRRLSWDWWLV